MLEHIAKLPLLRSLRSVRLPLLVSAVIAASVTAIGVWGWLTPPTNAEASITKPGAEAAIALPPQDGAGRERVAAEVIRLTPNGFEPSEVTRPKGRFILHVENSTMLTDISLALSRKAGGRERESRLVKKRKWVEMIDLPPGQYLLTEASHPSWTCQINITPQ